MSSFLPLLGLHLVGGSSRLEGNVFIGSQPVCDDYWNITEAGVVCRQLGLGEAVNATSNSHYGEVPDNFAMDDVACAGTERTLQSCRHKTVDNCDTTEGSGVVCSGGAVTG